MVFASAFADAPAHVPFSFSVGITGKAWNELGYH